ncbi:MAG: FkbM family methyltransferase [Chitinophagales bacterium]|nr:FkbM family methyltransferase [Chitinophagales bacterium]
MGSNWLESTFYSQHGEDVIIRKYFPKEKNEGFFVDVGAYQPVSLSNTYYFYLKGWRGINIEPNPAAIEAFKRLRPKDINVQMGVAEAKAVLDYHMIADKPFENTFSTGQLINRHGHDQDTTVVKVPVDTLANILKRYVPAGKEIDFFSIDVEGLNYQVLKSNDWTLFRPSIVVVEKHFEEQEKNKAILELMNLVGYQLDHDIFDSYFFVNDSFIPFDSL